MSTGVWTLIALGITVTTAAPFVLIRLARRADERRRSAVARKDGP